MGATTSSALQLELFESALLTLEIVEARGLVAKDISLAQLVSKTAAKGKSDPFVRVFLGGRQIAKTRHVRKTLDPRWDAKVLEARAVTADDVRAAGPSVRGGAPSRR